MGWICGTYQLNSNLLWLYIITCTCFFIFFKFFLNFLTHVYFGDVHCAKTFMCLMNLFIWEVYFQIGFWARPCSQLWLFSLLLFLPWLRQCPAVFCSIDSYSLCWPVWLNWGQRESSLSSPRVWMCLTNSVQFDTSVRWGREECQCECYRPFPLFRA